MMQIKNIFQEFAENISSRALTEEINSEIRTYIDGQPKLACHQTILMLQSVMQETCDGYSVEILDVSQDEGKF